MKRMYYCLFLMSWMFFCACEDKNQYEITELKPLVDNHTKTRSSQYRIVGPDVVLPGDTAVFYLEGPDITSATRVQWSFDEFDWSIMPDEYIIKIPYSDFPRNGITKEQWLKASPHTHEGAEKRILLFDFRISGVDCFCEIDMNNQFSIESELDKYDHSIVWSSNFGKVKSGQGTLNVEFELSDSPEHPVIQAVVELHEVNTAPILIVKKLKRRPKLVSFIKSSNYSTNAFFEYETGGIIANFIDADSYVWNKGHGNYSVEFTNNERVGLLFGGYELDFWDIEVSATNSCGTVNEIYSFNVGRKLDGGIFNPNI